MANKRKPEGPRIYRGEVFIDQRIEADGCQFEDCTFGPGAVLVYRGGKAFVVLGDGSTPMVEFAGAAQNTMFQLRVMYAQVGEPFLQRICEGIRRPFEPTN